MARHCEGLTRSNLGLKFKILFLDCFITLAMTREDNVTISQYSSFAMCHIFKKVTLAISVTLSKFILSE